jgi:phosphatidylserine/phosphatidylglycerophosphate/cardiolipin synthase-like enzyme
MNRKFFIALCLSLSLLACQNKGASLEQPRPGGPPLKGAPARVYFDGDCTEAVLQGICDARSDIFITAQTISPAVAAALIEARKGGVTIEAIVGKDRRKLKNSTTASLAAAGIPVHVDSKHVLGREEFMVIDSKTVITGSFDCDKDTKRGMTEKLTIIKSPELAVACREDGKKLTGHTTAHRTATVPVQKNGA